MQRKDIDLGTEYARTGKMVFGRASRERATRTRFTSLTPSVMIREYRKNSEERYAGRNPLERTFYVPVAEYDRTWQVRNYKDFRSAEIGEVFHVSSTVQGGLPAQVFSPSEQRWNDALVSPSEVHMTWAEYEVQDAERVARLRTYEIAESLRDVRAANRVVQRALRDLAIDPALAAEFEALRSRVEAAVQSAVESKMPEAGV